MLHVHESAKAKRVVELLAELKGCGRRPLIFSQWTSMLDLLEPVLTHHGYTFVRLDGNTPVKERCVAAPASRQPLCVKCIVLPSQGLIELYTEDRSIFVFLLSTRYKAHHTADLPQP